jgi:hypothetical protein
MGTANGRRTWNAARSSRRRGERDMGRLSVVRRRLSFERGQKPFGVNIDSVASSEEKQ